MKDKNGDKTRVWYPPMKRYVNAVERRLKLPRAARVRVMSDFMTSIGARREQGETDEAIMAALGKPAEAAAELNRQMAAYTYRKSPWRFAFLASAALCAAWLIGFFALRQRGLPSVGVIGGADGPTAIFVTSQPAFSAAVPVTCAVVLVLSLAGFWFFGHRKRR